MWVVIPVKSLGKSKQRLGKILTEQQRQLLAEAMLKDVLVAVRQTPAIHQVLVVTSDDNVKDIALNAGAEVLIEPESCTGLNDAVSFGIHHAELHGGSKALVLHGDLPLANREDLVYLVETHLEGGVTLVPDEYENGTNGMIFDLPTEIEFQYGEGSYRKHLQMAGELGLICNIAELPDLTLDIDSPDDLLELANRVIEFPELATAQYLLDPEMQQAIVDYRVSDNV